MTRKLIDSARAIVVAVWLGTLAANGAEQAFDAAPFGLKISDPAGATCGLRWAEPRKVRSLVVEFAPGAALPGQDQLRVEYWHRVWDGRPDPVLAESGAGSVGWAKVDDWTNGNWKRADATIAAEGNRWIVTFAPTGAREFKNIGEGVGYRKTIQLRLASDKPLPPIANFQVLTDAIVKPLSVRISFGKPAGPIAAGGDEAGRLEAFNGAVGAIRPLAGSGASTGDPGAWLLQAGQGAFEADLAMAVDPADARYDRTIVTVRSAARPFSFAADEVARGDRILVDDLGVLVTRGDDAISLDACRALRSEFPGRTIWSRVADESEQTLSRAWQEMPLKRPLYFVHGLPGNRNVVSQDPNAQINVSSVSHWFRLPKSSSDTARKLWKGDMLHIDLGFPPDERRGGRELRDGYLPVLRTWWQQGPLYYEATTVLDALEGDLGSIAPDAPTVLLMRIRVANTSDRDPATARLLVTSRDGGGAESLALDGLCALARDGDAALVRCLFNASGKGQATAEEEGIRWSLALEPGQSHNLVAAIPSITLKAGEPLIQSLADRDFDAACRRACAFWRELTERGARIVTPEPWLNDFYASHARHLLINCYREIGSDRLHAHVGTFHYGVFPNESAMMVSDLDRRGFHREAQQNLDSFLHYQGTAPLPGNFQDADGLFYGDGGHEMGGYNKSHGYVMWLMAYHWRMTRDGAWMDTAAPNLVKACDWVTRQRRATMTAGADGSRPIEYGFLPTGGLEDVQDYWYWLATNAATVWGFEALAAALADFGHPRGPELVREAAAFRDDFTAGITESRIRSPVVRLRDGTYVPKIPSHLHLRGRAHGWIRETLEGALFLPAYGLLRPEGIETKWILQDYEDNLYISSNYGYAIPNFDRFWFSRGGFSMQANLLDGPIPYLKRDEIKHYVRAYFNAFASAFYPEIRMCNEHSLPELGYPAGDHFKSSDEAQSAYWLRLMFVHERDGDLYLGQAIPRYWLADGQTIGIQRAASEFGPLELTMTSRAAAGELAATVTGPTRNPPKTIYVRFRHPQAKRMQSVTVSGRPHDEFNAEKEWVVLPGAGAEKREIVVRY